MRYLLTALGTNHNSSICTYLKNFENNYLVGTDIYPAKYIPASIGINAFYQTKSIYEMDTYAEQLFEICKKEKIDILIPIIDEEVLYLSENIKNFNSIGVKILVSNAAVVKFCRNKMQTQDFLKKYFPQLYIKTEFLCSLTQNTFPLFIKPNNGRASTNCIKINNEKELMFYKEYFDKKDFIVQEYIDGDFYTADFFYDTKNDYFITLIRQELVRNKNGCGIVIKIVKNEYLEKILKSLISKIGYNGIGNCEFICKNDKFFLVEINPRFSAGIDYSIKAGVNFLQIAIDTLMGNKPDILSINPKCDTIFVRKYETYEM